MSREAEGWLKKSCPSPFPWFCFSYIGYTYRTASLSARVTGTSDGMAEVAVQEYEITSAGRNQAQALGSIGRLGA